MKRNHGLTLIEIAIAVLVVALLFAVGLPAYQARLTRQIVAEAIDLAAPAKETVQEYANLHGKLPTTEEIALPFVTSRYVAATSWASLGGSGTITVLLRSDSGTGTGAGAGAGTGTGAGASASASASASAGQDELDAKSVTLTASYNAAARRVEWLCGGSGAATVAAEYLPEDCRP